MRDSDKRGGHILCAACTKAPECVYRLIRGKDIVYCESFDDGSASSTSRYNSGDDSKAGVRSHPENRADVASGPLEGLCVNCDRRTVCHRLRATGGAWRCEDYC